MKLQPLTLSFLDLVFSALAATTILNVVLAATAGRSQHELDQDFVQVEVVWRPNLTTLDDELRLTDPHGKQDKWTFREFYKADKGPAESTSVFFRGPLKGGLWAIHFPPSASTSISTIRITTKRETRTFSAVGAENVIRFQAHSSR